MIDSYVKAIKPETFRVLGKTLKPFSIGHEFLLILTGNAFSSESKSEPTIEDLTQAIWICSHSPLNPAFGWKFKFWLWILRRAGVFDESEKHALFIRYLSHYRHCPEFLRKNDPSGPSDVPFEQHLKVYMQVNFGWSSDQALTAPYNQVIWDYMTHLEMQGSIQIVDNVEEIEREAFAQQPDIMAKAMAMMSGGAA